MKIKLKNKHLFFAVESVWSKLDYKLKYQINQLVTTDDKDDTIQEIDFTRDDLQLILTAVNNQPQGIAREINPEMFLMVQPQVQAIIVAEMQGGWKPELDEDGKVINKTEAMLIGEDMQRATANNDIMKANKIENGKTQILA